MSEDGRRPGFGAVDHLHSVFPKSPTFPLWENDNRYYPAVKNGFCQGKTTEFMMAPSRGKSSTLSFPEVGHHATPFFGQVIDLSGLKHYSNGCATRDSAATAGGLGESHRPRGTNPKLMQTFGSYGSALRIYY